MSSSSARRRGLVAAWAFLLSVLALLLVPSPAAAQDLPERNGARVGLSILGGVAGFSHTNHGPSTTTPMVGASLRFGGAFSDRVHLYGEFSLAALPGATFDDTSVTAFLGSLDVGVQVYILPRLYARANVGAIEHATLNDGQKYWAYPGPHLFGAIGFDVHRRLERAFSLEIFGAEEFFEGDGTPFDRGYNVGLAASFDWF